jgi:hypothetical protein
MGAGESLLCGRLVSGFGPWCVLGEGLRQGRFEMRCEQGLGCTDSRDMESGLFVSRDASLRE